MLQESFEEIGLPGPKDDPEQSTFTWLWNEIRRRKGSA
jgi:hypothetical protein